VSAKSFRDVLLARVAWAGIELNPVQVGQLEAYWSLLERWNGKINLTSLPLSGFPASSVDRLLIEPLVAGAEVPDEPLLWFDLGSGGGSPAIPLKTLRPRARLIMVEAKTRKSAFLREVVRTLDLLATRVLTARIEELPSEAEPGNAADLISVRAVKITPALGEAARWLMKTGGLLLSFGGGPTAKLDGFELVGSRPLSADAAATLQIYRRLG
jgi:16S rRNA (guanine527-N7)-methyltransferase